MTTEYTWAINQMDHKTVDGFVTTVHYSVLASDNTNVTSTYGTVSFSEQPETLIPYNELTEEIVIGWIQPSLREAIEAALQSQLDALAAPVSASGLPW